MDHAGKTDSEPLLYEEIAERIGRQIEQGAYRPGERIPSIRTLSTNLRVSINTVMGAYARLENAGLVEARPQSGYYVRSRPPEPEARPYDDELAAKTVEFGPRIWRIRRNLARPCPVQLSGGAPNPALLPIAKLNRIMAAQMRLFPHESVSYSPPAGFERLRTQIARRSPESGCTFSPKDIIVTSGGVEGVTLALQATCRAGDTVAIGSPVYHTYLASIQGMGLKVLEIPSSPRDGLNVDVLAYALRQTPVRACLILATFNNPLGGVMPDNRKRALVELLARHDIPLIEDDVYGDLGYAPQRPFTCKAFDKKGLVLLCSSFSKTLAPGYRVGWIVPGRFQAKIEALKACFSVAAPSPTQLALAEFLTNGGYDRHLRTLRKAYVRQVEQMRAAIGRHFPKGTHVTRPEGGSVLWIEMPAGTDGLALHERALKEGIAVAPGAMFTLGDQYRNCIRVNAAFWSNRVEAAIARLGKLAK
ncbi:PLP-dependent aminotransferase family protein [Rhizomicrobium electricum]|jgi:DNA-binding transcriptional MocR family regulator|uniref:PLP-dependent aminotransferase family protein n=1 Tax=Rhizomicrobium electricum TaxID=480070 RepID=A0ABP3Q904_9PROT|nr:PLP-dependent aminotransferase family protein [Rhizomicrobium electricum]NIJ50630.1 DNA-binding transcriptional MocR family regulator [Rhizomicrobium electricum]